MPYKKKLDEELEIQNTLGNLKVRVQRHHSPESLPGLYPETRDPDAMDVDINAARVPQLSWEEKKKLLREKRCFHCRKEGHQARDCPDKAKEKGEAQGQREVTPDEPEPPK
jgi:hypothetical protein